MKNFNLFKKEIEPEANLSPIKRWQQEKKSIQMKMILSLFLSNFLTFLLCMPGSKQAPHPIVRIKQEAGSSIIQVNVKSIVKTPINKKIKVSLITRNGSIITNGFLWPSERRSNGIFNAEEIQNLKIEIASNNLNKIKDINFNEISIFPMIKEKVEKKYIRKEKNREIIF